MKCLFDCGIEHGYSEPCAHPESPFYDSDLVVPEELVESPKKSVRSEPMSQVERNRRWRARNREKYNSDQRDLMRERRK